MVISDLNCAASCSPNIIRDLQGGDAEPLQMSVPFTHAQRAAQRRVRARIWRYYRSLKAWRRHPSPARRATLSARFDRIFGCKTGFATLDRLLARLRANKSELLRVLERLEIPLNTNGSENDIRCQVTKRKISGGTRSDAGRDCRDAFLGLIKTCAKLGIGFLELPRRTPRRPRLPGNPRPRRNRQRTRPKATLIAKTFAPVTRPSRSYEK